MHRTVLAAAIAQWLRDIALILLDHHHRRWKPAYGAVDLSSLHG
jgi:hypothetical protein